MNAIILVIEDEKDIREFVSKLLIDQGHTVYPAEKGIEGLELAEKVSPDLVVLDLNLPDIDGESVCKQLKDTYPETQVLMLTARDTSRDLAHGLNIGADDYMTKPIEPEVLKARVNARLRTLKSGEDTLQVADVTLNPKTHEVLRNKKPIELSPQEYKLLHYFMTNPNQVLTRETIIASMWDIYAKRLMPTASKNCSNQSVVLATWWKHLRPLPLNNFPTNLVLEWQPDRKSWPSANFTFDHYFTLVQTDNMTG